MNDGEFVHGDSDDVGDDDADDDVCVERDVWSTLGLGDNLHGL